MRTITVQQRRDAMIHRHHLAGDADGPEAVTRALIALHATDPASVYLSVLARSAVSTLADVADAMYEQRSLVRWMAMRRTLFVFARDDIPTVQAAISTPLATTLRRSLISRLQRNGSEPVIDGDVGRWLAGLEDRVDRSLARRGTATGAQLADDEPALRTLILARAPSDRPQNVTTSLLTLMSANGRIVRGTPTGPWTSRHHRWEPVLRWWPQGLPSIDMTQAQRDLARRWLARFGPATTEDLQWWTGWNKTTTRLALDGLQIEEVDLHGHAGIELPRRSADELADETTGRPTATLLPALDPTPMGWKTRDWFLGIDPSLVFDRAGNIGPTLWWNGEIIGAWAITPGGDLRTKVIADRGAEAEAAIEQAASQLHARLDGAAITPAIRTPVEQRLQEEGS
ncbi:MAG TPA: winged helix DNA-binding domain-containing protein [Solirubrobacteraceae bacterium]|nr:winged helix DNA-binding domain-containing protein [Solirubrobacteraceae bacterium]